MSLNFIFSELDNHIDVVRTVKNENSEDILRLCNIFYESIVKSGRKLIVFGNGGSAADAQHFSAELTGRFRINRRSLPAIALTTDSSALTAIGNDFGFENVFSRQLESLAQEGDIVLGISTSGNSKNIIKAFEVAKKNNATLVSFTGNDGGELRKISDININIGTRVTARIQEAHIIVIHIICEFIDRGFDSK